MSLNNKTLLIYCDDPDTLERVQASIDPIHDHTIYAKELKDATFRIENQVFSAIIYAGTEELSDPLGLFQWVIQRHDYKEVPWIILDLNDSAASTLKQGAHEFKHVVLNEKWTTKELFAALDTIFPPSSEGKRTVDPQVINSVIASCTTSLSTNSKIKLERETPYILEDGAPSKFGGDLSLGIKFETSEFKSSLLISFQKSFALATNKALKNSEKTSLDEEVFAALKSLGIHTFNNIQNGLGKLNLEAQNQGIEIKEKLGLTNRHQIFGINLCVPFQSEKGPVTLECVVALKPKK